MRRGCTGERGRVDSKYFVSLLHAPDVAVSITPEKNGTTAGRIWIPPVRSGVMGRGEGNMKWAVTPEEQQLETAGGTGQGSRFPHAILKVCVFTAGRGNGE